MISYKSPSVKCVGGRRSWSFSSHLPTNQLLRHRNLDFTSDDLLFLTKSYIFGEIKWQAQHAPAHLAFTDTMHSLMEADYLSKVCFCSAPVLPHGCIKPLGIDRCCLHSFSSGFLNINARTCPTP